jgi:threonine/homoserine/homoserine lactone efflux protein
VSSQTVLLSSSYVGIATAIHLLIVLLAGTAHNWLLQGRRKKITQRIFALMIAAIAIWFLITTA